MDYEQQAIDLVHSVNSIDDHDTGVLVPLIAAALRAAAQAERDLLRKYMAHVMDMEGTAYTEFRPPHPSTLPMTTDDLARLEQIEAEIRAA
jgi:hypothetical protein